MRRQLLALARQLEQGGEPAMATDPELYHVRSAAFIVDRSASWVDITRTYMPAPLAL